MQPIRINYWGMTPITKRGYLIALAFEVTLGALCVAVVLYLGWPPLSTLWRQPPTPPRPVPWFWFYCSFYRILLLCLIAQCLDTFVVLRAFARKEAELRAQQPPEKNRGPAEQPAKAVGAEKTAAIL